MKNSGQNWGGGSLLTMHIVMVIKQRPSPIGLHIPCYVTIHVT